MENESVVYNTSGSAKMKALLYLLFGFFLIIIFINIGLDNTYTTTTAIVGSTLLFSAVLIMGGYAIYSSLVDLTFSIEFGSQFIYINSIFMRKKIDRKEAGYHFHYYSKSRGGTGQVIYICKLGKKNSNTALPNNMERQDEMESKIRRELSAVSWDKHK